VDSSTDRLPNQALVSEEEIARLKSSRVSLKKSCDLLGHSYPHVRRLVAQRKLITVQVGARQEITMYEIRRFLKRGNATEQDWKEHEGE
jgi:hypothetical protein